MQVGVDAVIASNIPSCEGGGVKAVTGGDVFVVENERNRRRQLRDDVRGVEDAPGNERERVEDVFELEIANPGGGQSAEG